MATVQVMRQAPLDSNVGKLTFDERCVVYRMVNRNQKEGVELIFQVIGHAPFDGDVGAS